MEVYLALMGFSQRPNSIWTLTPSLGPKLIQRVPNIRFVFCLWDSRSVEYSKNKFKYNNRIQYESFIYGVPEFSWEKNEGQLTFQNSNSKFKCKTLYKTLGRFTFYANHSSHLSLLLLLSKTNVTKS